MPAERECRAERNEVLDDAVVHNGDGAVGARVRVRVDIARRAVCRPARVRDAEVRGDVHLLARSLQVDDLALREGMSESEHVECARARRQARARCVG